MSTRRQFIQAGVALSATSLPALSSAASMLAPSTEGVMPPVLRLERFIYDDRHAEARQAARQAALCGVPLVKTAGDLTELWYHDLDLRWKAAPMALAGVTTRADLFVLETLAVDRGMRVVYRGEHDVPRDRSVRHVLTGPRAIARTTMARTAIARTTLARTAIDATAIDATAIAPTAAQAHASPSFWTQLGDAMTRYPLSASEVTVLESRLPATQTPPRDVPLISWVIAPRALVAARA